MSAPPKRYAEGTDVPVERSRSEIEATLKKHGASAFFSASDSERGVAQVGFRLAGRLFRLEIRTPTGTAAPKATRYEHTAQKAERVAKWVASEERRRWRAQLLLVKAKLEMVATGETTVEREFLADMLMPDGQTVAQAALPSLAEMYRNGGAPSIPLLGAGRARDVIDGEVER